MNDKRRHERFPLAVEVEVTVPDHGKFLLRTKDLSDGGAFLRYGNNPAHPALGAEVSLQLNQLLEGEYPPTLRGKVVRLTTEGFGVAFPDTGKNP
jgi:hypothetical protein